MSESACCPAACSVPLVAEEMSRAGAETRAAMFEALADPARVHLVNLLATSEEPSLDPGAMARLAALAGTKEAAR